MIPALPFDARSRPILRRADLLEAGMTVHGIAAAVRAEHLIRIRRDHYGLPGTRRSVVQAVRIGGRVACVSALADVGIHVLDASATHVHLATNAARSRSPHDRSVRLTRHNRDGAILHWAPLVNKSTRGAVHSRPSRFNAADARANDFRVSIVDALIQAALCQHPWQFVASVDSALRDRHISTRDVGRIFAALPARLANLETCIDARSESGQESVLRMILVDAGIPFEIQVNIDGVGRVDFLIDGCLVLEADSRLAHDGWEAHARDRERDIRAAALGYPTLRVLYSMVMFRPDLVRLAIQSALTAIRGVQQIS